MTKVVNLDPDYHGTANPMLGYCAFVKLAARLFEQNGATLPAFSEEDWYLITPTGRSEIMMALARCLFANNEAGFFVSTAEEILKK